MSAEELQFFKFPTAVIRSGLWARLSPAARVLYAVLLSFTDRSYCPVYPGSNRLLELTGFKQKSSLRRAREELQEAGLVHVKKGSGRTNSTYHFLFHSIGGSITPQGSEPSPLSEASHRTAGEHFAAPQAHSEPHLSPSSGDPRYNQIHISIQNSTDRPPESYARGPGWEAARNECLLAGIPPTNENVQKILSREKGNGSMAWNQILESLKGRVSPGSIRLLAHCFRGEESGWIRLSDEVPEYLKTILQQISDQILFEPEEGLKVGTERNRHWNQLI